MTRVAVTGLSASLAPVTVRAVTFDLAAGVHALVGAPSDGPSLLLAVLAGRAKVRAGSADVLGAAPPFASVRRAVAYVPMDPSLPDALRVDEALALSAKIRGDAALPPADRLERLDLSALARRPVRTLVRDEARAVALAEALTSPGVRALLVDEPLASMDARLASRLPAELRAATARGVITVLATASSRDASTLADSLLVFDRGTLVRRSAQVDPAAAAPATGARLRIVASSARALLGELAKEEAVTKVGTEGKVVVACGDPLSALAEAVSHAALRANVEIFEMRPDLSTLEELRAASAGAQAAYQAAFARGAEAAKAETARKEGAR